MSVTGLLAGVAGSAIIAAVSVLLLPFCAEWDAAQKLRFAGFITGAGTFGTLLDSVLGALLQESVIDVRTGKIVEAPGGGKVLVAPGEKRVGAGAALRSRVGTGDGVSEILGSIREGQSRKIVAGWGVLSNNGVNFVMALTVSLVAMAGSGWWWGVEWTEVVKEVVDALIEAVGM